mmetsp:Transcript_11644/g.14731  ORF Transcript_11644/g.14731 Transcript_11644/m.14731 type:complete len:92 (-) Transcript_11644:893-1168(-)|eukprot:CAMPEP_0170472934 /NCGR_PEP_ID=MMETSP0123-20130129/14902_1 /TAXON_ID=182087 /ORGANISM="Favella ehrenbergii, Strain Fehren 1" /LENGTH=91 /DNA_ID=CAMNT_0010741575 /DNA_START=339 /DNA_END=614 /DNA_ORIENTATION=+
MDEEFARAEETKSPYTAGIGGEIINEIDGEDNIERNTDNRDGESANLAQISEKESAMNRSILIVEEHDKQHKTEAKQGQILDQLKNKPLPF